MRVAGVGFRANATVASLQAAIELAGGNVQALATAEPKAETKQMADLASAMGLPVHAIPSDTLAEQTTLTPAPAVETRFGAGSLAEAAALAAIGAGARLTGPRVTSPDGMATAAIAEGIPS